MVDTVKIGNSWYVLEDICGIVGAQTDPDPTKSQPAVMLMRGGHLLRMTDLSEEVVEYVRTLRDPAKGQQSLLPPSPQMEAAVRQMNEQINDAGIQAPISGTSVDMSPETVIDVPAEKPA